MFLNNLYFMKVLRDLGQHAYLNRSLPSEIERRVKYWITLSVK